MKAMPPGRIRRAAAPAPLQCPPPDVWHYNHYFCCDKVQAFVAPANEAELIQKVKQELLNGQGHLKSLGHVHTGNDDICTDGTVFSTEHLTGVIGIERFHGVETVVAEAGITVYDLNDWLHQRGWTLGQGTLEFRDASIAGAIATGAHGSSLKESSVLSSRVESVWMVTPRDVRDEGASYQAAKEYSRHTVDETTWHAIRANMGALGIVTRVRLRIEPEFNLDVTIDFESDSDLLADGGLQRIAGGCDWGQLLWFPRHGQYMRMCGVRTTKSADRDAENTLLNPEATDTDEQIFVDLLKDMASTDGEICVLESFRTTSLDLSPPLQKRCGLITVSTRHAIGPAYKMMSSRLTSMQLGIPQNDFEVAIPMTRITTALREIQQRANNDNLCLPLTGVFLRFTRADNKTLIAHSTLDPQDFAAGTAVAFAEIVVFRPPGGTTEPSNPYFKPYFEALRSLIVGHHGRAHWAKNQRDLFQAQVAADADFADRLRRFRAVAAQLDPDHRLINDFSVATQLTDPP
jgi:hypothetical protein